MFSGSFVVTTLMVVVVVVFPCAGMMGFVCFEKKLLKLLFYYQVGFTQVFRNFSVSSRYILLELLLDIVMYCY